MKIPVVISQCLSKTAEIEVPDDFKYDEEVVKQIVKDTIMLPSDCVEIEGYRWDIDYLRVV